MLYRKYDWLGILEVVVYNIKNIFSMFVLLGGINSSFNTTNIILNVFNVSASVVACCIFYGCIHFHKTKCLYAKCLWAVWCLQQQVPKHENIFTRDARKWLHTQIFKYLKRKYFAIVSKKKFFHNIIRMLYKMAV